MEKQIVRELLNSGWLAHYGQEAAELGLTTPQMEMCLSLGITPTQFKASKDRMDVTLALVNGRKPDMEAVRAKTVDLFHSPKSPDLTAEQLKLCGQLGITVEQFKKERACLMM